MSALKATVTAVLAILMAVTNLALAQTAVVDSSSTTLNIADFRVSGANKVQIDPNGNIIVTASSLFKLSSDTGISRDGAGAVFAFGNGDPNNKTGTLNAATFNAGTGFKLNGTTIQVSTMLTAGCLGQVGSTANTYILFPTAGGSANCTAINVAGMPMAYGCTAKNMYVVLGTATSAIGGIEIDLYNGSTQTLHCTVFHNASSCHDTSNTATFAAGDTWSVRAVAAASDNAADIRVAFQCQ